MVSWKLLWRGGCQEFFRFNDILAAHLTEHPEAESYPAIYVCVKTMHGELEAFVERWLAERLPVPGTPGLSLAEELPRHPERAEARIVVEQLSTSSPQEELVAAKEALAVAEKEVELQKHFVTVRSRDMDRLFTLGTKNAEGIQELSGGLCAFVDRFRDLNLAREVTSPYVQREVERLECEAENLYDVFSAVHEVPLPEVRMERREEGELATGGGRREPPASSKIPVSTKSSRSQSSSSMMSVGTGSAKSLDKEAEDRLLASPTTSLPKAEEGDKAPQKKPQKKKSSATVSSASVTKKGSTAASTDKPRWVSSSSSSATKTTLSLKKKKS